MTHSNHSDEVPICKFRKSDLCQLVRLISHTITISYGEVYPPRAVQFFRDFHSTEIIAERCKTGTTLVVEEDGEMVATGSLVGGEILAVFVHPTLQKGGRGKAIMNALAPRPQGCALTWQFFYVRLEMITVRRQLYPRRYCQPTCGTGPSFSTLRTGPPVIALPPPPGPGARCRRRAGFAARDSSRACLSSRPPSAWRPIGARCTGRVAKRGLPAGKRYRRQFPLP